MKINFKEVTKDARDNSYFTIDPYSHYFPIVSRKIVVPLQCVFALGCSSNQIYKELFGFETKHTSFYDTWRHVFVDRNAMDYERAQIVKEDMNSSQYLMNTARQCEMRGGSLFSWSKKIRGGKLGEKSNAELQNFAQKAFEDMAYFSAYLLFPLSIQSYFEQELKKLLTHLIKDDRVVEEAYAVLAVPSKENFGFFEQQHILELAAIKKRGDTESTFENKLNKYIEEYSSIGVKYGVGKLWTREEVIERITYLSKENPEERLAFLTHLPQERTRAVEALLQSLQASDELKRIVSLVQTYIFIRTYRTDVLSGAFANVLPLFEEIGHRNNLSSEKIIECLPHEIINFDFPNEEEIMLRSKEFFVRGLHGNLYYVVGEKAKDILKYVEKTIGMETKTENTLLPEEFKGAIAQKGKVSGVVKVVHDNREISKIQRGDILVASMTTPDFVPAMERASAFITDEGGMLCHAAIVSREMRKPCIIGTKVATRVLHDGDEVEVNADTGVVKILKRA